MAVIFKRNAVLALKLHGSSYRFLGILQIVGLLQNYFNDTLYVFIHVSIHVPASFHSSIVRMDSS